MLTEVNDTLVYNYTDQLVAVDLDGIRWSIRKTYC